MEKITGSGAISKQSQIPTIPSTGSNLSKTAVISADTQHRQDPSSNSASSTQPFIQSKLASSEIITAPLQQGISKTGEAEQLRGELNAYFKTTVNIERAILQYIKRNFSPAQQAQFTNQYAVITAKGENNQPVINLRLTELMKGTTQLTNKFLNYVLDSYAKHQQSPSLKKMLLGYIRGSQKEFDSLSGGRTPKDLQISTASHKSNIEFLQHLTQFIDDSTLVSPPSIQTFNQHHTKIVNDIFNKYVDIIIQIENPVDHPKEGEPNQEVIITEPTEEIEASVQKNHLQKQVVITEVDESEMTSSSDAIIAEVVEGTYAGIRDISNFKFNSRYNTIKVWDTYISSLFNKITNYHDAELTIQALLEKLNSSDQIPKEIVANTHDALQWLHDGFKNYQEIPLTLEAVKFGAKNTLTEMMHETFNKGIDLIGNRIYNIDCEINGHLQHTEMLPPEFIQNFKLGLDDKKKAELFPVAAEVRAKNRKGELTFGDLCNAMQKVQDFYKRCTNEIDQAAAAQA